ncbi:A Q resistance multidrug resistance transporter [Metschnikowia bicuspidata var. bicuspidata NRRL YB-4993]|uniref:A Q resistance multidrug resistance transporter n=1 Tax=Metschnikowia bicuspidata var. bicuspidata NRRL YB-4993 TaxID=869754 RepID=A0A1A0HB58_9ASCO|nr:A Q resistance multidrug resistance transporter [Metschnikowia bicuspidata var. bicuspidata NRRL YB-4993]OBA21246.1 A Q resistance multidrug resistance transporter [Metschnikowia bicuspidata var. bicuspidata NRRL YB-4993]
MKIEKRTNPNLQTKNRVPSNKRRGLLSSITIMPEYHDPRNYRPMHKFIIVCVVAFAGVSGPMGTSILLPAVDDLSTNLDTTLTMVNVSIGVYMLSVGIFPMWWSNFSENHGRRTVYVISFSWFLAFSIACAVAPSIGALIVLRFMAGIGASSVQACGAGTVSDLYIQEERGTALGLFYLGPLLGPFLSPIIGGAVAEAWGWRATMWVMVVVCGLNLILIIFLLPETLPKNNFETAKMIVRETLDKDENLSEHSLERIATNLSQTMSLQRQIRDEETPVDFFTPSLLRISTSQSAYSKRIRDQELAELESRDPAEKKSWKSHIYDYAIRPMHAVILLSYPPVLLIITYSSITFMGVYFFNITISNSYAKAPYSFSPVIIGLMYIPNSVTYFIASIYGGRWNDWLIKRSARLNNGELRPESRLSWNIVMAALVFPPACMIFGWCLDKKQHWVTPLVGSTLFGLGSMIVIGCTLTYLTDLLPGKGATGVALNNLVRQILAAVATFITEPLINALGTGVLFCIYAGVVSASVLSVWYLKRKGAILREKYDITSYYAKL